MNNEDKNKNTAIYLEGVKGAYIGQNTIEGFDRSIGAKDSEDIQIDKNIIKASQISEENMLAISEEIKQINEAIELLENQGVTDNESWKKALNNLSPIGTQIFLFLLRSQGLLE